MKTFTSIKQMVKVLKENLSTSETHSQVVISSIYEFQTEDEKVEKDSKYRNKKGFRFPDAKALTEIALKHNKGETLTEVQKITALRLAPVYARQYIKHAIATGKIVKNGRTYIVEE